MLYLGNQNGQNVLPVFSSFAWGSPAIANLAGESSMISGFNFPEINAAAVGSFPYPLEIPGIPSGFPSLPDLPGAVPLEETKAFELAKKTGVFAIGWSLLVIGLLILAFPYLTKSAKVAADVAL